MLGKILTKVIIDLPKTNTPQVSDKPSAWLVVVMKMWKSKMLWADELNRAEISARVLKKKKKKELVVRPGRVSLTTVWPPQKAIKTGWWASI